MDEETPLSSSSELSDDSEDADTVNKTKHAEELEGIIGANKYAYDAHKDLVTVYEQLGELELLRAAYQRFHTVFPLTPELWLNWITVEKSLATGDATTAILKLFEGAVEDYLSIDVWQEYIQYAIGCQTVDQCRQLFQRALQAGGLHVADGQLLWDTISVYEMAQLSLITSADQVNYSTSPEWQRQIDVITTNFRRHLAVPLLGLEETYTEWLRFCESIPTIDASSVEWSYKQALKQLDVYKPYESRLCTSTQESKLHVYTDYVKIVKDPSTKITLYERAITDCCLDAQLWLDYIRFMHCLDSDKALKLTERALRNCTWTLDLWLLRMRLLEGGAQLNAVLPCFELALSHMGSNCTQLWLTYMDFAHRNRRTVQKDLVEKIVQEACQQLGDRQWPEVVKLQAHICAKNGDMRTARHLWKKLLNHSENRQMASVWLELAHLERIHGDAQSVREVYARALKQTHDWPQLIASEWLLFERLEGTLEQLMECEKVCLVYGNTLLLRDNFKRPTTSTSPPRKIAKARQTPPPPIEPPKKNEKCVKDPKLTVFVSNLQPSVNQRHLWRMFPDAVNVELVTNKLGQSRCYGYIQFKDENQVEKTLARDRELLEKRPVFISRCRQSDTGATTGNFKYSTKPEETKLFVRNIPGTQTQQDVEAFFGPFGATDVRLVMSKAGKSKGLAFVEFKDKESAQKALSDTDGKVFGGAMISVAISAPPEKRKSTAAATLETKTPVRHSKSRLQVPLVPRQVAVKQNGDSVTTGSSSGTATKRCNADFRSMFLNCQPK